MRRNEYSIIWENFQSALDAPSENAISTHKKFIVSTSDTVCGCYDTESDANEAIARFTDGGSSNPDNFYVIDVPYNQPINDE